MLEAGTYDGSSHIWKQACTCTSDRGTHVHMCRDTCTCMEAHSSGTHITMETCTHIHAYTHDGSTHEHMCRHTMEEYAHTCWRHTDMNTHVIEAHM